MRSKVFNIILVSITSSIVSIFLYKLFIIYSKPFCSVPQYNFIDQEIIHHNSTKNFIESDLIDSLKLENKKLWIFNRNTDILELFYIDESYNFGYYYNRQGNIRRFITINYNHCERHELGNKK